MPHAHIHLIPMQNEKDMLFSNPKLKLTDEEFKAVEEAIRAVLYLDMVCLLYTSDGKQIIPF